MHLIFTMNLFSINSEQLTYSDQLMQYCFVSPQQSLRQQSFFFGYSSKEAINYLKTKQKKDKQLTVIINTFHTTALIFHFFLLLNKIVIFDYFEQFSCVFFFFCKKIKKQKHHNIRYLLRPLFISDTICIQTFCANRI